MAIIKDKYITGEETDIYGEEETHAEGGVGLGAGAEGELSLAPVETPVEVPESGGGGGSPATSTTEVVGTEEPIEEKPYALPEHADVPIPEFDPNAAPEIKFDPAPAYEKTPEQLAWEELYGGTIQEVLAEGGKGIDEETQQLMRRQQFDILKAKETESLRKLRNDMEQRGITNSGLIFSEEQKIRSATTRGIAASMTEIQIKSAFIKMASFENALGKAGQFLGYLADQSMYAHSVEMKNWEMAQQAKLVRYQANMDLYKIKLQDACNKQNMYLQQQLQSELNTQVHSYNIELAEMEIDAAKERAKMEMGANIIGMILGGISGLF